MTKNELKNKVWSSLNEIIEVCLDIQLKKTTGFKGSEKIAKIVSKTKKELSKL